MPIYLPHTQQGNNETQTGDKTMTTAQIKNAKIDAISTLQAKYNRFAKGLATPGVDKAAVEKVLEGIRKQIDELETELVLIG
jgi:hypothetical protein